MGFHDEFKELRRRQWKTTHPKKYKPKTYENNTGYYRVSKSIKSHPNKDYVYYNYRYYVGNKQKGLYAKSIRELESVVRSYGLPWAKIGVKKL